MNYQVKNIARKYKKQYEDLLKGSAEEGASKSASEAGPSIGGDAASLEDSEPKRSAPDGQAMLSVEEKTRLESELQRVQATCEEQKTEIESLKQERNLNAVKALRAQVQTLTQEKTEHESELNTVKEKLRGFEMNQDEGNVRFAGKLLVISKAFKIIQV